MDAPTIALVLVPILIIQVGLMLFALYDLFQEDRRVKGDKIIWALVIAFVNIIGPLIYFFAGRDEFSRRGDGRRQLGAFGIDRDHPGNLAGPLRHDGRGRRHDQPDQAVRRHRGPGRA